MEMVLSHKKEWGWVSSSEVDEPRACYTGRYTDWNKSEREKYHILTHTYGS